MEREREGEGGGEESQESQGNPPRRRMMRRTDMGTGPGPRDGKRGTGPGRAHEEQRRGGHSQETNEELHPPWGQELQLQETWVLLILVKQKTETREW